MPVYFPGVPQSAPLAFNSLGTEWLQPPVDRPEGFSGYHYLYCQKGRGVFHCRGKDHLLLQGQGVLVAPRVPHSYYGLTENWTTAFASFTGSLSGAMTSIVGDRELILTDQQKGEEILDLLCRGMQLVAQGSRREQSVCCYELLVCIAEDSSHVQRERAPLYERYVAPAMQYIQDNCHRRLTVEELSSHFFVSPQYLARLFQRFLGCSTHVYINAKRMERARQLLTQRPVIPVWQVARQCGFDHVSHFIGVFKDSVGVTPVKFRAQFSSPEQRKAVAIGSKRD